MPLSWPYRPVKSIAWAAAVFVGKLDIIPSDHVPSRRRRWKLGSLPWARSLDVMA